MKRKYMYQNIPPSLLQPLLFSLPSGDYYRTDTKLVPWEPGSEKSPPLLSCYPLPKGSVLRCPNPLGPRRSMGRASTWHCSYKSEIYFQNSPLLTPSCHAFIQTGLADQKLYSSCQLANLINLWWPSQGIWGHLGTAREICFSRTCLSGSVDNIKERCSQSHCKWGPVGEVRKIVSSQTFRENSFRTKTIFGSLCNLQGLTTGTWHSLGVLRLWWSEFNDWNLISQFCHSKCGPGTCSTGITLECFRKAESQVYPGSAQSTSTD